MTNSYLAIKRIFHMVFIDFNNNKCDVKKININ
jgi:hypothetical protein